MSIPSGRWDKDESNEKNNLALFLSRLTRHESEMIKGIKISKVAFYLSLDEKDFLKQLQDSLKLCELEKLSTEEKKFRENLIERTMAVWRRNKEGDEQRAKAGKQELEYWDAREAEGWTPKHHDVLQERDISGEILSITETSRLHDNKNVRATGVISGVQPLRKMIKGISV